MDWIMRFLLINFEWRDRHRENKGENKGMPDKTHNACIEKRQKSEADK